jgi:hypothetical protein
MSLSNLANWRGSSPRTNPPPEERAEISVPNVESEQTEHLPIERAKSTPHVDVAHLTAADVVGLSTESVNMLIPHNPGLVAQLIIVVAGAAAPVQRGVIWVGVGDGTLAVTAYYPGDTLDLSLPHRRRTYNRSHAALHERCDCSQQFIHCDSQVTVLHSLV